MTEPTEPMPSKRTIPPDLQGQVEDIQKTVPKKDDNLSNKTVWPDHPMDVNLNLTSKHSEDILKNVEINKDGFLTDFLLSSNLSGLLNSSKLVEINGQFKTGQRDRSKDLAPREPEPETHGNIPSIISRMDKESIGVYMKALESGSEIKHDIRVIIVGKKGAGKTSLVRNLLKESLDNVESTNGIHIHVKRCKIRTADGKWFFQKDSFISDVSQRMMRSMITQTKVDIPVEGATSYVQSRDTPDPSKLAAIKCTKKARKCKKKARKKKSSDVINEMQLDKDLREIIYSAKDMDDEEYASLSLWDFAGDREFYNTHQTFLSKEAVYLVVTKLNETDYVTKDG